MEGLPADSRSSPSEGDSPDPDDAPCPNKARALVRLLGDEDPGICFTAWQHLEKIGDACLPFVREAVRGGFDARVQAQAARFLSEWRRRDALRRWVRFCRKGRIALEDGVFLIAETEYPDTDMGAFRRQLDEHAAVLRKRLAGVRSIDDAVRCTAAFLFGDLGFRCESHDSHEPDNIYINRVMELRQGIPVSISVLFLFLVRRLSVPLRGVGLPKRFLLKYRNAGGEVFVDPLDAGRLLTARDCARFLSREHIPFLDDYLRAVTDTEVLTRMLGNLLRFYVSQQDQRRGDRIAAMVQLLATGAVIRWNGNSGSEKPTS